MMETLAKLVDSRISPSLAITESLNYLRQGRVVALPTETVYGLAADAACGDAVARIYQVKGRPAFNPLIAHVSDIAMVDRYCYIDPLSRRLMESFWPGPLSLVLPLKKDAKIHHLATSGLSSLAVRCPCGIFNRIIAEFGAPLVAPSANRSGRLSPTEASAVFDDLGSLIPLIIDGGSCQFGLESTILKIQDNMAYLLRPGSVSRLLLEEVLGQKLLSLAAGQAIEAPGQLVSHYAPQANIVLNSHHASKGEAFLNFGAQACSGEAELSLDLSPKGDLTEAAANLFSYLKRLDQNFIKTIIVAPIPNEGLGEAINDRLRRAAAPRL